MPVLQRTILAEVETAADCCGGAALCSIFSSLISASPPCEHAVELLETRLCQSRSTLQQENRIHLGAVPTLNFKPTDLSSHRAHIPAAALLTQ